MPGLDPGIHVLAAKEDVDGRDKPGHDENGFTSRFILSQLSHFAEHAVIADNGRLARLRRLHAALADAALERLECGKLRNGAAPVLRRALDEMDEGVIVEPDRKIADAVGLCSL